MSDGVSKSTVTPLLEWFGLIFQEVSNDNHITYLVNPTGWVDITLDIYSLNILLLLLIYFRIVIFNVWKSSKNISLHCLSHLIRSAVRNPLPFLRGLNSLKISKRGDWDFLDKMGFHKMRWLVVKGEINHSHI